MEKGKPLSALGPLRGVTPEVTHYADLLLDLETLYCTWILMIAVALPNAFVAVSV
jgi:hypothetical protein